MSSWLARQRLTANNAIDSDTWRAPMCPLARVITDVESVETVTVKSVTRKTAAMFDV